MTDEVQIILVESNAEDAALSIAAFQRYHISNELIYLKNGTEALDFILHGAVVNGRSLSQGHKVLLLDTALHQPGVTEILKQLKANPLASEIPVLLLASSKDDPELKTFGEHGVSNFILKPLEFEGFVKGAIRLGMNWTVKYQNLV